MEENKKEVNRLLNKLETIKKNHKGTRKGFTLVELLVVIAIVAILGTVSVVGYIGFTEDAKVSNDFTELTEYKTVAEAKLFDGSEVVIRSNSIKTNVVINGYVDSSDSSKGDKVYVHGLADTLDIEKIAMGSVHACKDSSINLAKIKSGHIELEQGSDVGGIYVYNETVYNESGTATTVDTKFDDVKITVASGVDQPKLSRSAVSINETTGTKVCTLVTDSSSEDYYLFKQGVYEQVKVVDTGKNINTDSSAQWANTTNNNSIETAADQIANDLTGGYTYSVTDNTSRTIEIKDSDGEVVTNSTEIAAATTNGTTPEQAADDCSVRGSGTEADPFMIYDYKTFQKITEISVNSDQFNYFKVAIEKTDNGAIDCTGWVPVKLYGSIDGCGVVMNNLDDVLFNWACNDRDDEGKAINTVTISNMTLNCNIFSTSSSAALIRTAADDMIIDNVNVSGQIVGYSVGGYVDYGSGDWGSAASRNWQVTFKNCVNNADLVSYGEGIGGFVQHPYCDMTNGTFASSKSCITIIDSIYNGKMTSVSDNMDYFAYQGNNVRVKETYSSNFIAKYGEISGVLHNVCTSDSNGYINCGNYSSVNDRYRPDATNNSAYKLKMSGSDGTLPTSLGDVYTLTKAAGAETVKVAYMINPNDAATESGSYTGTYLSETIDVSSLETGATFNTTVVKYCTAVINGTGVTSQGLSVDGKTYNVYDGGAFYGHTHNGANVYAIQYDSNGAVVAITHLSVEGSNSVGVMYNGTSVKSAAKGGDYEYDTGLDLSQYDVKVVFVDRDSTWYYNFNYYAEFNGTNVADSSIKTDYTTSSTYEVSGTKVIIHNIERKADRYNYGSLRYGIIVTPKSGD